MSFPQSLFDVKNYISVHTQILGYPPSAIGVTLKALVAISAELKYYSEYRDAIWSSEGPIINQLYIDNCLVIYSRSAK